jgi:hypothetical protein
MPSSVIRHFTYHAKDRRLEVLFVSGRRYCYYDVPPHTAAAMRNAFAKGEFFNHHIRDHFAYTREADWRAA